MRINHASIRDRMEAIYGFLNVTKNPFSICTPGERLSEHCRKHNRMINTGYDSKNCAVIKGIRNRGKKRQCHEGLEIPFPNPFTKVNVLSNLSFFETLLHDRPHFFFLVFMDY